VVSLYEYSSKSIVDNPFDISKMAMDWRPNVVLSNMLNEKLLTDVILVSKDGKSIEAHKSVLASKFRKINLTFLKN
jgi:hypothetical protein